MMRRKQNKDASYQWRIPYVRNHSIEFGEWLLDQGADIFAKFERGEIFKFRIGNQFGLLYETGLCNPFFNEMARKFKAEVTA